mgnify:CR=1 FL=1
MNYNVPKIGEIDIISKDAEILVFTEVKTQTTGHGGTPRSQIDEKKRDRIMNAVQHYMDLHELDCDFRFDVAEVILGSGKPQIQIFKISKNVIYPNRYISSLTTVDVQLG